jgi:hypothetical protein
VKYADTFPLLVHDVEDWEELEDDVINPDEAVRAALPSDDVLHSRMISLLSRDLHRSTTGVEFVDATHWVRGQLSLKHDPMGVYLRQRMYARIDIAHEELQGGGDRLRKVIEQQYESCVASMVSALRERVATFRAYNRLSDADVVVVRKLPGRSLWLTKREGAITKYHPTMDTFYIRCGIYFWITPPGEEVKHGVDL